VSYKFEIGDLVAHRLCPADLKGYVIERTLNKEGDPYYRVNWFNPPMVYKQAMRYGEIVLERLILSTSG
jgi:hypothetical protein